MFCPNCGTNLSDNVKFCCNCGAQQPQYAPQEQQPQYAPQDQYVRQSPSGQPQFLTKVTDCFKNLTKKQLITIVSAAAAVIVAIFLIFFFACGGCDASSQKSIMDDYISAVRSGNISAVSGLYCPQMISGVGYGFDVEEFIYDYDELFDDYGGERISASYEVNSIEDALNDLFKTYMSDYGISIDMSDYINEAMDYFYAEFRDEFGVNATEIAVASVKVMEFDGDADDYITMLVKVGGKWYIGGSMYGDIEDLM